MRATFLIFVMLLHTGLAAWCCCVPLVQVEQEMAQTSCCSAKQANTFSDEIAKDCRCAEEVDNDQLLPVQDTPNPKPMALAQSLYATNHPQAATTSTNFSIQARPPPEMTPTTHRNRILRI